MTDNEGKAVTPSPRDAGLQQPVVQDTPDATKEVPNPVALPPEERQQNDPTVINHPANAPGAMPAKAAEAQKAALPPGQFQAPVPDRAKPAAEQANPAPTYDPERLQAMEEQNQRAQGQGNDVTLDSDNAQPADPQVVGAVDPTTITQGIGIALDALKAIAAAIPGNAGSVIQKVDGAIDPVLRSTWFTNLVVFVVTHSGGTAAAPGTVGAVDHMALVEQYCRENPPKA